MKLLCLRDCFVNDRFHKEGVIYEYPDNYEYYLKNFKRLEEPKVDEVKIDVVADLTPEVKPVIEVPKEKKKKK